MKLIVVIEIENLGFVYETKLAREIVWEHVHNVFFVHHEYDLKMMNRIKKFSLVATYSINGNQLFFGKGEQCQSSGIVSAALFLLDSNFNLKIFIKERENYSIPFNLEIQDQKIEMLFELFPNIVLSAN